VRCGGGQGPGATGRGTGRDTGVNATSPVCPLHRPDRRDVTAGAQRRVLRRSRSRESLTRTGTEYRRSSPGGRSAWRLLGRRPKIPPKHVLPSEHGQVLALREALPERYQVVAMVGAGLGLRQTDAVGPSSAPPKYGEEREVPPSSSVTDWPATYQVTWPARAITLPWRDADRSRPTTVSLTATTPGADGDQPHLLHRPSGSPHRARRACPYGGSAPDAVQRRAHPQGNRCRPRRRGERRPCHRCVTGRRSRPLGAGRRSEHLCRTDVPVRNRESDAVILQESTALTSAADGTRQRHVTSMSQPYAVDRSVGSKRSMPARRPAAWARMVL
jgi:hypothetical protein